MYTNQTGKFPVRSIRGQQYQVVAHHIDSNWKIIETTKRRIEGELIEARRRILRCMQERGIVPKHQVLDNEVSRSYKGEILAIGMTFQLALPDDHCRNIA